MSKIVARYGKFLLKKKQEKQKCMSKTKHSKIN